MSSSRRVSLSVIEMCARFVRDGRKRECGECQACCTALSVVSLGKPGDCRCAHLTDSGCGIYEQRPAECRGFSCMWLMGWGNGEDRPDRSGLLIYVHEGTVSDPKTGRVKPYNLIIMELEPGAVQRRFPPGREPEFLSLIGGCYEDWVVKLMPFGVPRVTENMDVKPPYRVVRGLISDQLVGNSVICVLVGGLDESGNLHAKGEIVPSSEVRDYTVRVVNGMNLLASPPDQGS